MTKDDFLKELAEKYDDIALWRLCDLLKARDDLGGWIPEGTFQFGVALGLDMWHRCTAYALLHPKSNNDAPIDEKLSRGRKLAARAIQRSLKAKGLIETCRLPDGKFKGEIAVRPTTQMPKPAFQHWLSGFFLGEVQAQAQAKAQSDRAKRGAATRKANQEYEAERREALDILDKLAADRA